MKFIPFLLLQTSRVLYQTYLYRLSHRNNKSYLCIYLWLQPFFHQHSYCIQDLLTIQSPPNIILGYLRKRLSKNCGIVKLNNFLSTEFIYRLFCCDCFCFFFTFSIPYSKLFPGNIYFHCKYLFVFYTLLLYHSVFRNGIEK
jgi:hypothetical protein